MIGPPRDREARLGTERPASGQMARLGPRCIVSRNLLTLFNKATLCENFRPSLRAECEVPEEADQTIILNVLWGARPDFYGCWSRTLRLKRSHVTKRVQTATVPDLYSSPGFQVGFGSRGMFYRGTSRIRKSAPLGPYSRGMPRVLRWS